MLPVESALAFVSRIDGIRRAAKNRPMKKRCLLAWAWSLLFLVVAEAGKVTSFYSTTARKSVAVLEDSSLEKEPEIDHFKHLCPGYGGYELIHLGGDLRSAIEVKFGETVSEIYGETMNHAPGMFAHKANDVVEWRGVLEGEQFVPHALIYRLAGSVDQADGSQGVICWRHEKPRSLPFKQMA